MNALAYVAAAGGECFVVFERPCVVLELHTSLHDDIQKTIIPHENAALVGIVDFIKKHLTALQIVQFFLNFLQLFVLFVLIQSSKVLPHMNQKCGNPSA